MDVGTSNGDGNAFVGSSAIEWSRLTGVLSTCQSRYFRPV